MMALRTSSGPNKAWRAGWVPSVTMAPARSDSPRHMSRLNAAGPTHPFAEPGIAADLDRREDEIETSFARLDETLRDLAPQQFDEGFPARAVAQLAAIGVAAEPAWFDADWTRPLPMGQVHARCACRLFARLAETGSERSRHLCDEGESMEELIQRWGFHAVDVTPCADGRLAGLLGTVLRVPLSIVTARKSFAGAMFDVAEAMRDWERVELGRFRFGVPNPADAATRYLKVGVYHFSSVDPAHEGCAAHGSDTAQAVEALHERLLQFRAAVDARHGAGDCVAILMVGVDTDTDAIRVHVPDASGAMTADRYVDAAELHGLTRDMAREAAKDAVRDAVAVSAGVDPQDGGTEGMRWFCGYLLKNNLAQVEAVLRRHGGPYPVAGHAEKLIVIGDPVDDVQSRNLAFQAQMDSVEAGTKDLSVGIRILGKTAATDVPVLVVRDYDADISGDREAAARVALRMMQAVTRFRADAPVTADAAIRCNTGGALEFLTTSGGAGQ